MKRSDPKVRLNGKEYEIEAAVLHMDQEIMEQLAQLGIENDQDFVDAYVRSHAGKFDDEVFKID